MLSILLSSGYKISQTQKRVAVPSKIQGVTLVDGRQSVQMVLRFNAQPNVRLYVYRYTQDKMKKESFDAYPPDVQEVIYNVKPGLTGIGSIVFRDEEELITEVKKKGGDTWKFYKEDIYPFKGELEKWYQEHESFLTDVKIIFITAWVILKPESEIVYKWFKDLPRREF